MSEQEVEPSTEVALPTQLPNVRTGELHPATPEIAAELLLIARDFKDRVQEAINACQAVLAAESARLGKKTLHVGARTVEFSADTTTEWDLAALRELLEAGLPQDRYDELVKTTIEYKVNGTEANRISGANPKYKEIVDRARRRIPKKSYANVR